MAAAAEASATRAPGGGHEPLHCTACAVPLESDTVFFEHYKTQWHRYNTKRKVAGLPPVSQALFDDKVSELLRSRGGDAAASSEGEPSGVSGAAASSAAQQWRCTPCSKQFKSEPAYLQHLNSKKHKQSEGKAKDTAAGSAAKPPVAQGEQQPASAASGAARPATEGQHPVSESTAHSQTTPQSTSHPDHSLEADLEGAHAPGDPIGEDECLFCHLTGFADMEARVEHMRLAHGFFIPLEERLASLTELLSYLSVKVGVYRVCLWCNRQRWSSTHAVRQHMRDSGHAKIDFEFDEGEEFDEFYDFGGPDEGEEEQETAVAAADGGHEAALDTSSMPPPRVVSLNAAGELVRGDGTVIGRRDYHRYYRQATAPDRPDEEDEDAARFRRLRVRDPTLRNAVIVQQNARTELIEARFGALAAEANFSDQTRASRKVVNRWRSKVAKANNKTTRRNFSPSRGIIK